MDDLQIATRAAAHGVTVIELSGQLDKKTSETLEKTLRELEDKGQVKIVVSCKGLHFLSSEASSVFLSHLIRIKKSGGDIRFCDVGQETRLTLTGSGLSKLLVIFESEADALSGFSEKPKEKKSKKEPPKTLSFRTDEIDEVLAVLSPVGSIDRHTIEALDEKLMSLLKAGRSKIVVDGSELLYISSNGMGVFIGFLSKFNSQGGDIRFCALKDIVKTVITTLGLHRLFRLFHSREEAVASFEE